MSLRLGERSDVRRRQRGVKRVLETLPQRPDVIDEGEVLQVIWYPHRDALPLLPSNYPCIDSTRLALLVWQRSTKGDV